MKNLTKKQQETIQQNYNAYVHNFETPVIERGEAGNDFYVWRNASEHASGTSWVQYCYNVSYLDGWLYGAVQAKCKQLRPIEEKEG